MNVRMKGSASRGLEAWKFSWFGKDEAIPAWVDKLLDNNESSGSLECRGALSGDGLVTLLRNDRGSQIIRCGDYLVRDAAGSVRIYSQVEFDTILERDNECEDQ